MPTPIRRCRLPCRQSPAPLPPSYTAGGCFVRHRPPADESANPRSRRLPHCLLDHGNELMHAEWFLDARRSRPAQGCHRLFVGNIAGDEDDPFRQFGAVFGQPRVYVGSVHSPRSAHIRHHAQEFSALEQPQAVRPRFGTHHRVTAAFERGTHIGHHSRFILNQQNRKYNSLGSGGCHRCVTPAAAPTEAVSDSAGRRTIKVAPSPSVLLWQRISPPCSWTMP